MIRILFFLSFSLLYSTTSFSYEENNAFSPNGFPGKTSTKNFSIAISPLSLLVVYPDAAEPAAGAMREAFRAKCGVDIPFKKAGEVTRGELAERDLVVIGNIADNPWSQELYERRFAFADAYFPGRGGVTITPAQSIWNPERNVIVVGVSADADVQAGFSAFVGLVESGAKAAGPLRLLKTSLAFPKPPASVSSTLDFSRSSLSPSGTTSWAMRTFTMDQAKANVSAVMAPYSTIANWGLAYHVSGDRKWAEHFLEGMRFCYERAEKTGKWIPEPWTNVYFCLYKMVQAWELIDDDPFFTEKDRKMIDEVLWGYTRFCDWLPNLNPDLAPPDEPRQNHTTFLALSLYGAHRYFTGKYGVTGLDGLLEKAERAFDHGAASSSRPNDDAGGYLNLAPGHLLSYQLAKNDRSFVESDKMGRLSDLIAACIDNRGDQVAFGDVGGYFHRAKGAIRPSGCAFFGMAATYLNDPAYRWLYTWDISSDKRKREMDFAFSLDELYTGCYATEGKEEFPARFVGLRPFLLDDAIVQWSARRSWKNSHLPPAGAKLFDKLTFRAGFDPDDEYLLIDGSSTFSHGHYDGNTVLRLTWKDRVWLCETDYIKLTPRYHNGVVVTRNGVQEEPAPLTELAYAADFPAVAASGTTSRDFNGADWTRATVWKKGRYFLFLDTVKALREGDYRLDQRWRTRGDIGATPGALAVKQGSARMTILTADDAPRTLEYEPDAFLSTWNYPWGGGRTTVWHARKDISLARNGEYTFASLMAVESDSSRTNRSVLRGSDGVYVVRDGASVEVIGTNADALDELGLAADCALFVADAGGISLVGVERVRWGALSLAAPAPVSIRLDVAKRSGTLIVPDGSGGVFRFAGMRVAGKSGRRDGAAELLELAPGTYAVSITGVLPDIRPFVRGCAESAVEVAPGVIKKTAAAFGLRKDGAFTPSDSLSVFCADGAGIVYGDRKGGVHRFEKGVSALLFRLDPASPVTAIHAADLDGDGKTEILTGDEAENLRCHDAAGNLRWRVKLTKYYGPDADVRDIVTADLDGSGKRVILAATNGWKLYAVNPDGAVRWEAFTFYHPQTKVRYSGDGSGAPFIAVGTAYQTPLNVVSPRDGRTLWYTWEEMGSEFIAKTQYCGICLTDMAFIDVDGDGKKDIVFGTKYNTIYALDAQTGAAKWEANVGDEVTAVRLLTDHVSGEPRIAVATDAGDLLLLDRSGKRILTASLGAGIVDMAVIALPGMKRNDIAAVISDGRVVICDDRSLLVRASSASSGIPFKGISAGNKDGVEVEIHAVGEKRIEVFHYRPFDLRKMRTD